jgi:hypothetical protein
VDKRLFFIYWESDTHEYSSLGLLPSLPEISIRRVEQTALQVDIAAMTFKDTVADMRSSVPTAVATQVGTALVTAWQEGVARAHAQGCFVEPVVARVGLRLWDGSLYYLSEAIEIPDMSYVGYDAVAIPLVKGSDGYTGTGAAAMAIPNYQLSVRVERGVESDWSNVVQRIELYISSEQELLSGSVGSVHYVVTSDNLRGTLAMRSSALMGATIADQPMLLTARYSPLMTGEYGVSWRSTATATQLTAITPPDGKAQHICSHGGFLHILSDKTLTTQLRGNPFVVADATVIGEEVTAMVAQPCGGGAYTRQYLYLFGESGVYALTHDFYGNHVNCRRISPLTIADSKALAVADDGVWIISREGVLAQLKDSKVQETLRGLTMADTLAWHRQYDELWVLSAEWRVALVLHSDDNAYLRTVMPQRWVSRHGELIYLHTVTDKSSAERVSMGMFRVSHVAPASGDECETSLLILRDLPLPEGGVAAQIFLYGNEVDASVRFTITVPMMPEYERTMVGSVKGNMRFARLYPLRAPRTRLLRRDAEALAEITISGRLPMIKYVKLNSIDT